MTWAPDYVTRALLKSYLRIEDDADDVFIDLWITTVSRNVDDFCGRQFGKVASLEARTYTPVWDRHIAAYVSVVDDLQDVTGLTIVDEDGTAVTDYDLDPVNAVLKGHPYERILTTTSTRSPVICCSTAATSSMTLSSLTRPTSAGSAVSVRS